MLSLTGKKMALVFGVKVKRLFTSSDFSTLPSTKIVFLVSKWSLSETLLTELQEVKAPIVRRINIIFECLKFKKVWIFRIKNTLFECYQKTK